MRSSQYDIGIDPGRRERAAQSLLGGRAGQHTNRLTFHRPQVLWTICPSEETCTVHKRIDREVDKLPSAHCDRRRLAEQIGFALAYYIETVGSGDRHVDHDQRRYIHLLRKPFYDCLAEFYDEACRLLVTVLIRKWRGIPPVGDAN